MSEFSKVIKLIFVFSTLMICTALSHSRSLNDAISSAESAVSSANAEISRLNGVLRGVDREINRVRGEINTANNKASNAVSETSALNRNAKNNNIDASVYRKQKEQYEKDRRYEITRKNELTVKLEILLEENFKLDNEIHVEQVKYDSLVELYKELDLINNHISLINSRVTDLLVENKESLTGHVEWLNKFNEVVIEYKPEFTRIKSAETYKEEYSKITQYAGKIPSLSNVKAKESKLLISTKHVLSLLKSGFESTRKIPAYKGVGLLSIENKDSIIKSISSADIALSDLYTQISGLESSVYKREYKRFYLIDFTEVSWARLVEESLIASNINDASEIINSISLSTKDNLSYAKIRSILLNKEAEYKKIYRSLYSLRHARRKTMATLNIANNLVDSVSGMEVSPSTKSEISALLHDHKLKIENDLRNINSDLDEEDFYHQRRVSYATTMLSRYSSRMTPGCVELAGSIIESEVSGIKHEKEFMEFKGSCLR